MFIRSVIIVSMLIVPVVPMHAEDLGHTIKKLFATPTPTPRPHKKTTSSAKKKSPTPTPTASPKKKTASAHEEESPEPSPTASKKKATAAEEEAPTPTAKKKKTTPTEEESPAASPKKKKKSSPTPSPSGSLHHKKKGSPTPGPSESETPSPTPEETPSPAQPTPTPSSTRHGAANATLLPNQIKGFENYPMKVQALLTSALELTTRDLYYKYGSDDPASGGMDCSGFVSYVLRQNGIKDVPRDSSSQYSWLRKAHTFEAVMSQKDDSFELEDLKPGDLLFWTGTYSIDRDPPITHAMIYLGREKKTGNRVMVGSSDGRVYQGESRNGVSVFDFKVQRRETNGEGKLRPTFIGYGHIPGLQD